MLLYSQLVPYKIFVGVFVYIAYLLKEGNKDSRILREGS